MRSPTFTLSRNPFGKLVFTGPDGVAHEGVTPVRAFALSSPEEGIALLSAEGKELVWIDRLADLPTPLRGLIEEEFAQREFMPVIQRIVRVSSFATPSTWRVDTDRGSTELILKSEDDIRRLRGSIHPNGLLIADSNGIHYLIPDRNRLDAASRKILKRFL
ncbi:DUF1854 domain-containing protein [Sulfuricystis multivorans]|uniref:cyanophycin metabolism-associated DUF1854 family protein n=1 Tax=Sulfuricystis multivorans TaxID=2211108 RepID=UPI000F81F647|nr:DUF1854 domain-containing protein [Sulfuricystis multivorans]